eukprot:TRINITY_DN31538_c0_g1_i1.p1 TRINITY_DN31538_c0_g1~~TRINITY_DN31538_c0_g1_i1.p1  ORF type:complete len:347 (-),score=56.98 TRINITY_DN31538_c0_g1_i1:233-1273(-)
MNRSSSAPLLNRRSSKLNERSASSSRGLSSTQSKNSLLTSLGQKPLHKIKQPPSLRHKYEVKMESESVGEAIVTRSLIVAEAERRCFELAKAGKEMCCHSGRIDTGGEQIWEACNDCEAARQSKRCVGFTFKGAPHSIRARDVKFVGSLETVKSKELHSYCFKLLEESNPYLEDISKSRDQINKVRRLLQRREEQERTQKEPIEANARIFMKSVTKQMREQGVKNSGLYQLGKALRKEAAGRSRLKKTVDQVAQDLEEMTLQAAKGIMEDAEFSLAEATGETSQVFQALIVHDSEATRLRISQQLREAQLLKKQKREEEKLAQLRRCGARPYKPKKAVPRVPIWQR